MNENMSTGKIFVGGVGIVGLIGAAIYIYKRVKEAKKPIEITLDEEADENTEAAEVAESSEEAKEAEKTEKKAAITEKISKVSKKIGKSVGTFCLKFGAKHPKIAKGVLTIVQYAPTITVALICGVLLRKQHDIEITRYLPEDDDEAYKNTCEAYHKLVEDNTFVPVEKIGNDSDITFSVKNKELDIADKIRESWENGTGRTNWEKVKACADTLELNPHEAFAIYNIDEFEGTDAYKEAVEKGQKYFMRQQYACEV